MGSGFFAKLFGKGGDDSSVVSTDDTSTDMPVVEEVEPTEEVDATPATTEDESETEEESV